MFGPRIANVFKSRWNALFWAGGIMLTAYCSVPSPDKSGDAQETRQESGHHVNPWAKTSE